MLPLCRQLVRALWSGGGKNGRARDGEKNGGTRVPGGGATSPPAPSPYSAGSAPPPPPHPRVYRTSSASERALGRGIHRHRRDAGSDVPPPGFTASRPDPPSPARICRPSELRADAVPACWGEEVQRLQSAGATFSAPHELVSSVSAPGIVGDEHIDPLASSSSRFSRPVRRWGGTSAGNLKRNFLSLVGGIYCRLDLPWVPWLASKGFKPAVPPLSLCLG